MHGGAATIAIKEETACSFKDETFRDTMRHYAFIVALTALFAAVPAGSEMTRERVELGRHLFYDERLSGNGTQACATCHLQELAFTA